jgi:hypothetical protein
MRPREDYRSARALLSEILSAATALSEQAQKLALPAQAGWRDFAFNKNLTRRSRRHFHAQSVQSLTFCLSRDPF